MKKVQWTYSYYKNLTLDPKGYSLEFFATKNKALIGAQKQMDEKFYLYKITIELQPEEYEFQWIKKK